MKECFDIQADLISSIVALRQSQCITQQQLSEISGVKQPVIARLEKGRTDPQLSTIIKLLTSLHAAMEIKTLERNEDNDY